MDTRIKKTKSGQIGLISLFLVLSSVIFLYSIETQNYYNTNFQELDIDSTIQIQFCEHVTKASGLDLNNSLIEFDINIVNYCEIANVDCSLISYVSTSPPGGNFSLLNFSHISLNYSIQKNNQNNSNQINC